MDGTGITTIATGISRVLYGLAYDSYEQKIYWGDRSSSTMMRVNLDGSNPEVYYKTTTATNGIVIGKRN